MRRNSTMEPGLSYLILFIDEETTLLNDPLFSRDAVSQYQEKKEKYDRKKKVNNFLAKTEIQTNESFKLKAQKQEPECPVCGKSPGIEDCEDFLKLGVEERSKMIFKKKYYGCYQKVSRMHNAKNCTNRKVCKVCSGKHPTTLHGLVLRKDYSHKKSEKQNGEETAENQNVSGNHKDLIYASVNKGSQVISMSIVPVQLVHENSNKVINTHALLDNCNQGTFVMKSSDTMGKDGTPTSITIKTLNGDVTNTSVAVEGLKVCAAAASGKNRWVKIPKAFSWDELQVDAKDIATPEKIAKWEYLDEILHEISQSSDVEIGLLIGANCSKALEPNKIIPSRNGRLYAFRSILGWCVVGPVHKEVDLEQNLSCHKVSVTEIGSSKIANHLFVIQKSVEDMGIKQTLQKICLHEFTKPQLKDDISLSGFKNDISIEDQKFLKVMR